ncbi:hypothetical protein [Mucilaginibacter pedocola]|uniref:Uncharacterized protein n=1 Tax=Mucilaginibacter pedocola TaxID=1792845 RepID=A0A1S9PF48_9SPHI|nr:hypothetical protein [Mucilaginibacter pedocola]OOQ59594.1 hypothetical protein BC343_05360 [Mucilaginibacter pedocola]
MKRNLLSCIITVATIALVYTSCKKDAPDFGDNGGSTVSSKEVSRQIALNIAQSFYGGMGGFDLSDGMDQQINAVTPGRKKIVINSVNSGCGIGIDTTMNFSMDIDTMQMSINGRFKVSSTCVNGQPSSIAMYDSLLVSMITPSMAAKYNILQNLTVTSQDPANDAAKLTFSGIMNMKADLEYKTGSKPKMSTTFNYKLTSLVIDPVKDGDIISGSATFETVGNTPQGTWNYKGSIQFLGNHKVKITINGDVYTVDIQTGQIV